MGIHSVALELIQYSFQQQASDIYLLPQTDYYDLFIRIHGTRQFVGRRSYHETVSLISYLKYRAQMNISENRRPQSGTLNFQLAETMIQLRLSSIGNFENQESLVIRLLYNQAQHLNYFFPEQLVSLKQLTQKRGLLIFSGPTGSGKTTTMYHLAREIAQNETVIAIEDPIEIRAPEILQLQVNDAAAMSYADLLKGTLRHRPDTLLIGEIRDAQTAQSAVTAALSGHLVFTTLHARSSGGVVARLLDLGLSVNLLQNTLTGICYQRLLTDTKRKPQVLCDIVAGSTLRDCLASPSQYFASWAQLLQTLLKGQIIDQRTYKQFQNG